MTAFELQSDLVPAELLRLNAALKKCEFSIDDARGRVVFERFGQVLERLRKEERDLVLTLLEDFLHCRVMDLMPLLGQALQLIPPAVTSKADRVILVPLAEAHDGTPKSPSALLYFAPNLVFPYIAAFAGKPVIAYNKLELLESQACGRANCLVILLDDFIGSGESAVDTIEKYQSFFANPSDQLVVVAVAAQKQGVDRIVNEKGISAYSAIVRMKGISDSTVISDRESALRLMDDIERRLGVSPVYQRGFGQCEALVTLTRTPDNTFPVFWHPTTGSGEVWPAPFLRPL